MACANGDLDASWNAACRCAVTPTLAAALAAIAMLALAAAFAMAFPARALAADIGSCTVEVGDAVYTGTPVQPKLVVKADGRQLVRGSDYVTAWRRNVNAGAASVTVIGRGANTGRKTAFFAISRAKLQDAEISGVARSYELSGRAIEPKPKVALHGKTMREGLDYTLSYRGNAQAGTATVRIQGKRNLEGSRDIAFTITEPARYALENAEVAVKDAVYTGKAARGVASVRLGGKKLAEGTDFAVAYTGNVHAGTARAVITGKGSYHGSKAVTFKVKRRDIGDAKAAAIGAQAYTGKALKPVPKLAYAGKALVRGTDFTLSWKDNRKLGKGKAVVKGKGDFTGSRTISFRIGGNAGARIAAAAVALAGGWSSDNRAPGPTGSAKRGSWSDAQKAPPATKTWRSQKWNWKVYKKVYAKVNAIRPGHRLHHACCDCLPVLVALWAGVDDGYLDGKWPTVDGERSYLEKSGKWTRVGGSGKYWHTNGGKGYGDAGVKLEPGDILCSPKGAHKHLMVYVGHEAAAKRWGSSTKVVLVDEGYGSRWTSGKPMSSRGKAKWLVFRRADGGFDPSKSKYAGICESELLKYLVV